MPVVEVRAPASLETMLPRRGVVSTDRSQARCSTTGGSQAHCSTTGAARKLAARPPARLAGSLLDHRARLAGSLLDRRGSGMPVVEVGAPASLETMLRAQGCGLD